MKIRVRSGQKRFALNRKKIVRIAKRAMRIQGLSAEAELSLFFVSDAQIRRLNRIYRRQDCATDVLAFAMNEGADSRLNPQLIGDIVLSIQLS